MNPSGESRLMDKRRPIWPALTAALVAMTVLYVLSIGPAFWLFKHGFVDTATEAILFQVYTLPISLSCYYGPEWWYDLVKAYVASWG